MNPAGIEIQKWLFAELASQIGSAFEGMTGERPIIETRTDAEAPADAPLKWRQTFSGVPGAIWLAASEADTNAGGGMVLEAAGMAETDPAKSKGEFLEILNQVLSGMANAISGRLGREAQRTEGGESEAFLGREPMGVDRREPGR